MPEKAKPDEEPQVPAQEEELDDGDADEHVPEAGGAQIPQSARYGIPNGGVRSDPTVPEPQANRIDKEYGRDLDGDGVAQPDG